jgi:hypothetical protein
MRPSSTTLANFVGSVLSHSLNRAYLATVLRHFAQIPRYARSFRYAQPLSEMPDAHDFNTEKWINRMAFTNDKKGIKW